MRWYQHPRIDSLRRRWNLLPAPLQRGVLAVLAVVFVLIAQSLIRTPACANFLGLSKYGWARGCIAKPDLALGHWGDWERPCGTWLLRHGKHPRQIGVVAGKDGQTLARGRLPAGCEQGCSFQTWSTEVGPLVVATQSQEASGGRDRHWLGMRRAQTISFVSITPDTSADPVGENAREGVMLEAWACEGRLALRLPETADSSELWTEREEMREREGLYVPDGSGWLIVPEREDSGLNCHRLELGL